MRDCRGRARRRCAHCARDAACCAQRRTRCASQRAAGPLYFRRGRARSSGHPRWREGIRIMPKFEESLQKLEKVVQQLEKGDVPLDKAIGLFEEGIALSSACRKELEEAESKVEVLLKKDGKLVPEPFEDDEK